MLTIRQTTIYEAWFAGLRDERARARIDVRIKRLALGNAGNVKPVGEGVSELRRVEFAACGWRGTACS